MVRQLKALFPGLRRSRFRVTSPADDTYNCIAWAAGETDRWWWPSGRRPDYWPGNIPAERTLGAFIAAFATIGYGPCDGEAYEPGFEKIALFADASGLPTHAARQLANGRWTSKLGKNADIEHDLEALRGRVYGSVVQFMKRPAANAS